MFLRLFVTGTLIMQFYVPKIVNFLGKNDPVSELMINNKLLSTLTHYFGREKKFFFFSGNRSDSFIFTPNREHSLHRTE